MDVVLYLSDDKSLRPSVYPVRIVFESEGDLEERIRLKREEMRNETLALKNE